MKLSLYGHAAVLIESEEGTRLLVDPYESGGFEGKMAYAPIEDAVDAVVCTHDHADHCALHTLAGDPHHMTGARAQWGGFTVVRHSLQHDEYGGRRFGGEVSALRVEVDGLVVVHLSDVGHSPGVEDIEALWGADVVCVPVGGFYTIGAAQAREWCDRLGARVVIPMHYRTSSCQLPIDPIEYFVAHMRHQGVSSDVDDLRLCVDDDSTRMVVLEMMRAQNREEEKLLCTWSSFNCIQITGSNVSQEQRPPDQVLELKGGNSDGKRL